MFQVLNMLGEEAYKRDEFETNLGLFAAENNLESGHKALKKGKCIFL